MPEMRTLKTHYYDPQPDITSPEVAAIIPLAQFIRRDKTIMFKDTTWNELPDNVKRHFKPKG